MTAEALPAGLRERVLAAARELRTPGRTVPDVPDISPVEAYRRAADAVLGTLTALEGEVWRRPVLRDLDIAGLVGHLTGVEDDVQRALDGDRGVACVDHVTSTQPAAHEAAGRSPDRARGAWRAAVGRTLDRVRNADLDTVVRVHGMRLPLGALLVVRAFELWTHENDIRRAADLPASVPDAATLRRMTELAVQLLPVGMGRVSDPVAPVDVHLVLTGAGGGTWEVAVGERSASAAQVAIVADAVGFCRVVAARITPAELGAHVSGAAAAADAVLAGAAALALD